MPLSAPFDLGAHEEIALLAPAVLRAEEANFEMVIEAVNRARPAPGIFLAPSVRSI
jgi:hypothetical protein